MGSNNLSTVLDQDAGRALVKEYLDKTLLERVNREGVLANSAYQMVRGIPNAEGQYIRMTRKNHLRRPQNLPTPGGAGSDPLSGATLGTEKKLVPIEFIHEYLKIGTVANITSWIDLEDWAENDLPYALNLRAHELMQNALVVGRMTPGVYDASGTLSTAFDASAETTVSLYGISFTFEKAPTSYAGGADTFADMVADADTRLTWNDLNLKRVQLGNSGAQKINGKYMCVLSDASMMDLLSDGSMGEAFGKAIQGGNKSLLKGLEDQFIASFAGWNFMLDDHPFTEDGITEAKRAEWGDVHSTFCFGANAFGAFPLGGQQAGAMAPNFKVQDITLTGYEKSIGYLIPHQSAVVNPNWCSVIKAPVSVSKPNNYSDTNKQLNGFDLSAAV